MTRVGVLSDTHGLLRPEVLKQLQGVDLIIHAGDIGSETIIPELETIAPVYAVRGNVDNGAWAYKFPLSNALEVEQVFIYVYHGHLEPDVDPRKNFQVVISGHTHEPLLEQQGDILYLNPGSAGHKRFSLPVSMAELTVDGSKISAKLITLRV
jgi:putative phosphoesterase